MHQIKQHLVRLTYPAAELFQLEDNGEDCLASLYLHLPFPLCENDSVILLLQELSDTSIESISCSLALMGVPGKPFSLCLPAT